jgi:hypothetical protein
MRIYTNELSDAKCPSSGVCLYLGPKTLHVVFFLLLLFCGVATPALGAAQYLQKLEGYTLEPAEGWNAVAVKGWSGGDCVPFRYSVENTVGKTQNLNLRIVFDYKSGSLTGVERLESFKVPAGSVTGPYFEGDLGYYYWTVTVPKRTTYILEFCARLGSEAYLWPRDGVHVGTGDGAGDVLITAVRKLPDLNATMGAIPGCGMVTYEILYRNDGEADQINTRLVEDYDETKVEVTDDGGGRDDGNAIIWDMGTIPVGGRGNLSYRVALKGGVEDGAVILSNGVFTGDLEEMRTDNNRYTSEVRAIVGPKADAGTDKSILLGDSVTIGGSPVATGGSGSYTYLWSPAAGLDDPTKPNPTASPSGSANYTVTVTDGRGCRGSDDVRVAVEKSVLCGISGPESVCDGQQVAVFYYVGEDLMGSSAIFTLTWKIDGRVVGSGEEVTVDWGGFEFGRHDLDLEIVKENPDGTTATGSCRLEVLYVESPTASIIML